MLQRGKYQALTRPFSKVIVWSLTSVMKRDYTNLKSLMITELRKIIVNLTGRLNKWGGISPRFGVQLRVLGKWQNNLSSSCSLGFIVLTTSAGIIGHEEAR